MTGKLGDHVGNMLPSAVYTSVGCTLQGEAFQRLVNHLLREKDPECEVLASEVIQEAKKTGSDVLLGSHFMPTAYEIACRNDYLPYADHYPTSPETVVWVAGWALPLDLADAARSEKMRERTATNDSPDHEKRRQKLSREFEVGSATFKGTMSFRTWRDLHRQGFSTHWRSLLAFKDYYVPPDMSAEYHSTFRSRFVEGYDLYATARISNPEARIALQKMCMMGNKVTYKIHSNLRQLEFVVWQRTKYGAHHEVRAHARKMNEILAANTSWWSEHARVNDHDYFFARGVELPPIDTKVLTKEDRYPWQQTS
jgi:hypothetical protein